MNFDKTVDSILNSLVTEQTVESVAILPGGFKPPHKGHYEALKHIIDLYDATKAVIFIGNKERDGITADQSKNIWTLYGETLDGIDVEVYISDVTPVKSVYEYADENKDKQIYVGAGINDMRRYDYFNKNKDVYSHVTVVQIPDKFGRISGTATREKLQNNTEDAFDFIPDQALDYKNVIKDIL